MNILTVSQLNRYIKSVLEADRKLLDIYIKGEISNITRHFQSGHLYFTLKDEAGAVRAVMFRSHAEDLPFSPENGMSVLARANVGVYERDGTYQLYVTDLQPYGAGALSIAFEQLKAKLLARGVFDETRKRPLPAFPKRIGVVTSQTGAVFQDIVNILSRRFPIGELVICPTRVQGDGAAQSVIKSLQYLDLHGRCDVIIVGRGGGSAEDLWAFNDEALAYAVAGCETPVVSAVGHETDFTICDFAADLRAPTPSAAAEICAPDLGTFADALSLRRETFARNAKILFSRQAERLNRVKERPVLRSPMNYVAINKQRLDFFTQSLYNSNRVRFKRLRAAFGARAALLESLSPLKVMGRGYCAAFRGEKAVLSAKELAPGDEIALRFQDSFARARVLETGEGRL